MARSRDFIRSAFIRLSQSSPDGSYAPVIQYRCLFDLRTSVLFYPISRSPASIFLVSSSGFLVPTPFLKPSPLNLEPTHGFPIMATNSFFSEQGEASERRIDRAGWVKMALE